MKHSLLFLVTFFMVTYVQGQYYEPSDNRQYKEQYLLPEVMTNGNNCSIDLDILFCLSKGLEYQQRGYGRLCGCIGREDNHGCNIVIDFAQPYRTDTTITIIGLSGYFRYDNSICPIPHYLELRDSSNEEIIRSANVLDFYPSVAWDTIYPYKEVLFDTPINIKGKFYVVLHTIDSIENDYDYYYDKVGLETPVMLFTTLCNPSSSDMYPLYRWVNSYEWTTYDEAYTYSAHQTATMFYLFPILGEYDPGAETYNGNEVGISELKDITDITYVFPNPATEEVNINCGYKIKSIELYDEQGKLLYTKEGINSYNYTISLKDYSQGTYFVKIFTQTAQTTKKIIKK